MTKIFSNYYSFLTCIGILLLSINSTISYAQTKGLKDYTDKIKNFKDKSKEFKISGNIGWGSKYRFTADQGNRFEYNAQANINISYFGISMPISYRFTSGRSIIGINGPNINIPKFQNFGISPTYKYFTLHLGTRQLQFTPYTYSGIRFKGLGLEILPKKGYFIKVFRGKLRSPFEEFINLTSNKPPEINRRGFGVQTGYRTNDNEYSISIFKAEDQYKIGTDTLNLAPKENTAVSFNFKKKISELTTLNFEKSVSAFTNDVNSPRVSIRTHTTSYNMLGLFTRRENSTYRYATKGGIDFNLNNATIGIKYEEIDQGYKTLGTLFLDNDFKSYSLTFALPVKTKLLINGEFGIRNQGIKPNSENKSSNFIGMFNASYQFTDQVNSTLMISNLKSTQSSFSMINGLLLDSLRLTLSNKMISATTNVILGEEKDASINFLASYVQSNQIRQDSLVFSSLVHTSTFNASYSKRREKLTSNYMLLYTRNITEFQSTNIIGFTATHDYNWKESLSSKHSWNSNLALNSTQKSLVNLMSNTLTYNPKQNLEASLTHRILLNFREGLSIKDHFLEVDCRYKF